MKQLSLNELVQAFSDEPKTIADRLAILGYSKTDLEGKIPEDALMLSVYGSSFLKFLHENAGKLEPTRSAEGQTADINPFEDTAQTIGARLKSLELDSKVISGMFSDDVLKVEVDGEQFQEFILQNKDKFLSYVDSLPMLQEATQ
ncbi:MAG TPA: hypothetical protein VLH77_03010 [Gammaproteobacteria bacterium]|nr:hypothetical protein [Gammaproteobacteria bacterium]